MAAKLPDISQVNFCNASEVVDYARQLVITASDLGMFLKNAPDTPEVHQLRDIAKTWLSQVDATIASLSSTEAQRVIGCYDLVHRIAHSIETLHK